MPERYFDILPDRYRFRLEEFEPASYLISTGLSGLIAEVQQDRGASADANLRTLLSLLAVSHLGLPVHFTLEEVIAVGVEAALRYFRGGWAIYRPDEANLIRKSIDNKELEWYSPFRQGWLIASLSQNRAALHELADWLEPWLEPIKLIEKTDPLFAKLYLLMAQPFRREPFLQAVNYEDLLKKTRKKEIKALYRTWDCILNRDQAGFEQGVIDSVTLWEQSRHDGQPAFPRNCIAEEASALLATGRLQGLRVPSFSPPIAARLLTPESVGFSILH